MSKFELIHDTANSRYIVNIFTIDWHWESGRWIHGEYLKESFYADYGREFNPMARIHAYLNRWRKVK
jgi:hypothetical protein